jgi:hypothetical protein
MYAAEKINGKCVFFKMVSISALMLTETNYRKIVKIYILCYFNFWTHAGDNDTVQSALK